MKTSEKISSALRVQIISQALPYIQKFHGKTFVIKYGGSTMGNEELKRETIKDFVLLSCVGIRLIIVHGGGPEITAMSKRLNLPVKFVDGQRVTDKETMEIVEMVLVGKIQKDIVNLINVLGGDAIGLCGKDGNLFNALPLSAKNMKKYGFVGEVGKINPTILHTLLDKGFIPVISSVGTDKSGQNFNINADNVASSVASCLKAAKLILMTDTPGILQNSRSPDSLISKISLSQIYKLTKKKIITGGMIPKAKASVDAIKSGVKAAHIIDGRLFHSILLEVLTDKGIGTMITK